MPRLEKRRGVWRTEIGVGSSVAGGTCFLASVAMFSFCIDR